MPNCPLTSLIAIPMAMLKVNSSLKGHGQDRLFTKNSSTKPCLDRKLSFPMSVRGKNTARTLRKSSKSSRNCLEPIVAESDRGTKKEKQQASLAERWREIHGQGDWVGLLDPFDSHLRSELIRYGEMAQACYDAFEVEPYSKYCGSCVIDPDSFFESLCRKDYGYDVTSYLFSTYNVNLPHIFKKSLHSDGWSPTANWIGYVAVSNDEKSANLGRRDITIAWRGSETKLDWIADLTDFLKSVSHHKIASRDPSIKVEAGFLHVYTDKDESCEFSKYSAREQVLAELKRLLHKYENEELSITITGHSLGSALALLNAYDIAETGADVMEDGRVIPICVYSFSGPRVGNARFKERLEGLGVKVLRVVNIHDKVPLVPGIFLNEHAPQILRKFGEMFPWCYVHVGEELALDHKMSPFLKETKDLASFHNLEVHLHLLDGYHGKGTKFSLASGRDIALVNKESDFLKDDFLIPPNWSLIKNEGLNRLRPHIGQQAVPEQRDLDDHLPTQDVQRYLRQLGLHSEDY